MGGQDGLFFPISSLFLLVVLCRAAVSLTGVILNYCLPVQQ